MQEIEVPPASAPEVPGQIPGQLRIERRSSLRGRHVLVVGINYAPEPTGIAPYTTELAEHLATRAQSVTVLTGMPHYPQWQVTPSYRWRLRERRQSAEENRSGLMVRRLRHYVPRQQSALTRGAYEASFLAHACSTRVWYKPDLVVAVTPSLSGAVAGAMLAQRHDARLLVVVQDLMARAASQSGISGGDRASAATGRIERWALRRADRVAVVSDAFRPALAAYGIAEQRVVTTPNWTHIEPPTVDRATARRDLGWEAEAFTVVHTGNIGLKQDLSNMVAAARQLKDDAGVRLVIVGTGSQRAVVQAQAVGLRNITFVDPLDDEQYPKALAAADVLVVNERPGVGDMSLPSKLTSYLCAARPVLAAVGADGATGQELERTQGAALVVPPGDPVAFADGVRRLQADPERRDRMARAGALYAEAVLSSAAARARLDRVVEECLR